MVTLPKIPLLCMAELALELELKGSGFVSAAEGFGLPPSGGGPPPTSRVAVFLCHLHT